MRLRMAVDCRAADGRHSLDFARQFIEAAKGPKEQLQVLFSIEISLKYLLERTGIEVRDIRKRSHDMMTLLNDLGSWKST